MIRSRQVATALASIDAGNQDQADAPAMRCKELLMQHNVELMGRCFRKMGWVDEETLR